MQELISWASSTESLFGQKLKLKNCIINNDLILSPVAGNAQTEYVSYMIISPQVQNW